jgi:NDP-sugar pyrophosphorylase family protein
MTIAAGIIAAGDGTRLAKISAGTVKPLIPLAGRPLSHWILSGLIAAGAKAATVLTNSRGSDVPLSLAAAFPEITFDFVTADTASSFESFRLVSRRLATHAEDFIISTVDALIRPEDVSRFVQECRASHAAVGLAITPYIDDEKPLWVDLNEDGQVIALGDGAKKRRFATSGLYYLTREAAAIFPEASAHARLRDFLSALVASELRVSGVILPKTIDIDRPEDLAAAELFLAEAAKR